MKPRILFISHESSLTGATILLLNLLELLKQEDLVDFSIVISRGGPLDKRFSDLGSSVVLKPIGYQLNKTFPFKVLDFFRYKLRLNKARRLAKDSFVIFSNTVANGRLLSKLSSKGQPIVVYVHELAFALDFCDRHGDTTTSLKMASLIFSPARAVSKHLTQQRSIAEEQIYPLNYYFPNATKVIDYNTSELVRDFRRKYQIPEDKFQVVGMGAANTRKGIDLFVETCHIITQAGIAVHFTWIGDFFEEEVKAEVISKIKEYGLEKQLTVTGYLPYSRLNLLPFDLFALTSREDPYPLVALEAAFLELPVVGFAGAGGMDDFIGSDAGFLVDRVSPVDLADKIVSIIQNPVLARKMGRNAKRKAEELHSNANLVLRQFVEGLRSIQTLQTNN